MSRFSALGQAITLTDEILGLLEDKNFEAVAKLEALRQPVIERAFSDSLEKIDLIKAHHLQSLNQQVVEKLNELKQFTLLQQKQVRNASKATRAYASHQ